MKFLSLCFALLSLFVFSNTLYGDGQSDFNFGIHAGIGTDINLGIGYGGRFSFMPFGTSGTPIEVGAELFISHSEETTTEGIHDYDETTDLVVFGIMANVLYGYSKGSSGMFYILGIGLAYISVEWEETSDTDSSLGTPYGASGSKQSVDGSTAGSVINLGLGYNFGGGFELRFELPIIVLFSAPGEAAGVVPTATIMAGYRF